MSEDLHDGSNSDGGWDVTIAGDDGRLYKYNRQQLAKYEVPPTELNSPHYASVRRHLKKGVTSSVIPEGEGSVTCYVLNLASLRTEKEPDPWKDRFDED